MAPLKAGKLVAVMSKSRSMKTEKKSQCPLVLAVFASFLKHNLGKEGLFPS